MIIFYIASLVILIVSLIIQASLKSTVAKYSKIPSSSGITAQEACKIILNEEGVYGLDVQHIRGELSDCYSPKDGSIRLSDTTYGQTSVAAIAIAAHECGHAIQKEQGYPLYVVRQFLVPVCNFASIFSQWVVIIGAALTFIAPLLAVLVLNIAIFAYLLSFLFYMVLVPVEYNASNRALKIIREKNLVGAENNKAAKKVLRAAGRTYVIALASSALTLFRLVLMRNSARGRSR